MARLDTELRLRSPDDIYQALIAMIDEVGDEAGPSAMAALALTLANQLDDDVVMEAIELVANAYGDVTDAASEHILVSEALDRFFARQNEGGDVVA